MWVFTAILLEGDFSSVTEINALVQTQMFLMSLERFRNLSSSASLRQLVSKIERSISEDQLAVLAVDQSAFWENSCSGWPHPVTFRAKGSGILSCCFCFGTVNYVERLREVSFTWDPVLCRFCSEFHQLVNCFPPLYSCSSFNLLFFAGWNLVICYRNVCLQVDLDLEQLLMGRIGPGFCYSWAPAVGGLGYPDMR